MPVSCNKTPSVGIKPFNSKFFDTAFDITIYGCDNYLVVVTEILGLDVYEYI